MAILKIYNDEQVVELLNDDCDTENPYDSWRFDGNNGLCTDRTLFLYVEENNRRFWRSIHIRYNMANDHFYVNNYHHEEYSEIDLNDDDEILKYFMVNTEEIVDFQEMLEVRS